MKSDVKQFDIECYCNYFLVGIKDFRTKEKVLWEVSEERDDRQKIYDFFMKYNGFLVHFNGMHYDNIVISYLLKEWKQLKDLSWRNLTHIIKLFSDKVIDSENNFDNIKYYKWMKHPWEDIDLMLYWSKMLRISKKISLKALGIQLGYPVVQELPFHPTTVLDKKDLPIIRHYNGEHDLGILEMLFTEMLPDVGLRASIKKEYGLPCMSWDAPKIASEALLDDYCTKTYKGNISDGLAGYKAYMKEIRDTRFKRPTLHLNKLLKDFKPDFQLKVFKDLYDRILNSVDDFSETIVVSEGPTQLRLSYGIGGLHSINENEMYESKDGKLVVTSDFALTKWRK